jgi:hypothetical protein
MRLALVLGPILSAAPALAAPTISVSAEYSVGVTPGLFSAASNPLAVEGVVRDAPGAISVGHIDASAAVSPAGLLSFEHDQFGIGTGHGRATTRISQTFTNTAPGAVNLLFRTTVLAGIIGLGAVSRAGDDLTTTTSFPVGNLALLADLVFDITVDGVSLYSASASIRSGGGSVTETQGGGFGSLNRLTRISAPGSIVYLWENTDLSFDLGVLRSGRSRTVSYVLTTTTRTDSLCFWMMQGCGAAQVSFGDPRDGGGVINLTTLGEGRFLLETFGGDSGPRGLVPAPPALALLGGGLAALALRRRRTLP